MSIKALLCTFKIRLADCKNKHFVGQKNVECGDLRQQSCVHANSVDQMSENERENNNFFPPDLFSGSSE